MGQSVHDFKPPPNEQNKTIQNLKKQAEEAKRREAEAARLKLEAEKKEKEAKRREEEAKKTAANSKRMQEEANKQRQMAKKREEEAKKKMEEAARRGREAEEKERETRKMAEESQRIADKARRMEEEANRQRERAKKGEEEAKRQMEEAAKKAHQARMNEEAAKVREKEAQKQGEEARRMEREAIEQLERARKGEEEARKLAEEADRKAYEAKLSEDAARASQEEARQRGEEFRVQLEAAIQDLSSGTERAMQPTLEEIEAAKARIQYNPENLHFAITGTAGSGKSSLINALRKMKNSKRNRNAAKTGITETTLEIGRYPDPDKNPPRSRFIWYDVPGAGTLNVPGWQHFNDQALYVFDIILVVTDNRFTKIDVEILRNCERFKIPSFIIRSKADQHISNLMNDLSDDEDEDDDDDAQPDKPRSPVDKGTRARQIFISDTRESVAQNLAQAGLSPQDVYIVSNQNIYRLMSGADSSDMIDEKNLLRDALTAAYNRRYHTVVVDR